MDLLACKHTGLPDAYLLICWPTLNLPPEATQKKENPSHHPPDHVVVCTNAEIFYKCFLRLAEIVRFCRARVALQITHPFFFFFLLQLGALHIF